MYNTIWIKASAKYINVNVKKEQINLGQNEQIKEQMKEKTKERQNIHYESKNKQVME